jgi:hypothetical protein
MRVMSKLDDILNEPGSALANWNQHAKQQVKDLILELIGEDEPDGCSCTGSDCGDYLRPAVANGLRNELRKKVEKL